MDWIVPWLTKVEEFLGPLIGNGPADKFQQHEAAYFILNLDREKA